MAYETLWHCYHLIICREWSEGVSESTVTGKGIPAHPKLKLTTAHNNNPTHDPHRIRSKIPPAHIHPPAHHSHPRQRHPGLGRGRKRVHRLPRRNRCQCLRSLPPESRRSDSKAGSDPDPHLESVLHRAADKARRRTHQPDRA